MRTYRNPTARDRHFRAGSDDIVTSRRQPRPQPRRQGTRSAIIATAIREA